MTLWQKVHSLLAILTLYHVVCCQKCKKEFLAKNKDMIRKDWKCLKCQK